MNKLKVGIMGCASIAERVLIPTFKQSPYFELHTVASRTEDKAKMFAKKFDCKYVVGYNNLLAIKEIDVIYMPLPTGLHYEWAIKGLKAGKHLLIEKSLASNYPEAGTIIKAAKKFNLLVQENFMFEYHSQLQIIKTYISELKIGNIRCIRSSFGFPPFSDKQNIRYQKDLAGGALLDAGAYTIKVAQLILGDQISVKACILNQDKKSGCDIHGAIFLHNETGVAVETAFGFDNYYQCNLEIWGAKGKITADRIFTAGPGIKPTVKIEIDGLTDIIELKSDNHFLNLINDFALSVKKNNFTDKYVSILNQARLIQASNDCATVFTIE